MVERREGILCPFAKRSCPYFVKRTTVSHRLNCTNVSTHTVNSRLQTGVETSEMALIRLEFADVSSVLERILLACCVSNGRFFTSLQNYSKFQRIIVTVLLISSLKVIEFNVANVSAKSHIYISKLLF